MKKENKNLEEFVGKLMASQKLEEPSSDFTANIIANLQADTKAKSVPYKPLITNWVWLVLAACVAALGAYIYIAEPAESLGIAEKLNVSRLIENPFNKFNVTVSKTFMYSMVLFAIMLCVQIPVLKHYFNKRIAF